MSIVGFLAAFGGGALGAALGGLPAFIMTGFMALVGTGIALGGGTDFVVGSLAFGPFFGPHISFAGGVAAAAYAARKANAMASVTVTDGGDTAVMSTNQLYSGSDITFALNKTGDYTVILVGGIFGVFGYMIQYFYANVISLQTDTVAMTVATLGIITRLLIGKTGLIGKYTEEAPRQYVAKGNELIFNIVTGLIIGLVVCYVGQMLLDTGVTKEALQGSYPAMCFGISAITLIFLQFGTITPITHHISLPAANAFALSGNPIIGVVVAIICSLFGDFATKTFNSYNDSHIDPPACTIFIVTFFIFALFK